MANYTRKLILTTFENMLEHMPLEKITVTALIKECGIGRNTFYYHYRDIYDLLSKAIESFFSQYEKGLENESWQETLKAVLYACRDNRKKIHHIYNSLSRDRMEQFFLGRTDRSITAYIQRIAASKNTSPERSDVISSIIKYSVYGYLMHFFWNDMNENIEESIEKFSGVVNEVLSILM